MRYMKGFIIDSPQISCDTSSPPPKLINLSINILDTECESSACTATLIDNRVMGNLHRPPPLLTLYPSIS